MSLLVAVKLFASPLLIGLASLAGKRWGPNAAGLMGGLPLVAAPVVIALWMANGPELAAEVSRSAPVGVWATMVYLLTLGYASARLPWFLTILSGWILYLLSAFALNAAGLAQNTFLAFAVIPGLWLAVTRVLPCPGAAVSAAQLPHLELLARMVAAVFIVLALTEGANRLGAQMTGVLSGGPVAATVIPAFILAMGQGRDALLLALRGFLTGLTGFAVFFLVLTYGIPRYGAPAMLAALIAAVATGLSVTAALRRVFALRRQAASAVA